MFVVLKLYLFPVLLPVRISLAAFTQSVSSGWGEVQQDVNGTWCYYPFASQTNATSCDGDFNDVLNVHLNTTTSIGYYGYHESDLTRFGGADWPVPLTDTGIVTLCLSGMAVDASYQSACTYVTADNYIGAGCLVAVAQQTVTDGCYPPFQAAALPQKKRIPDGFVALAAIGSLLLVFTLAFVAWKIHHRDPHSDDPIPIPQSRILEDLTSQIQRQEDYPIAHGGYSDVYTALWYRGSDAQQAASSCIKVAVKVLRLSSEDEEDRQKKNRVKMVHVLSLLYY